ncbi:hypothetical protein KA517_01170 [Candidatus Gracilibacteria bacterium]|nr:hypothetical protein [Candidatus Gracilibacteria bacterium]
MLRMLDDGNQDETVIELREPKAPATATKTIHLTHEQLRNVLVGTDQIVFPNGHVFARRDPEQR